MIRNSINLKQLEAFVAVVDFGTFRNAAAHLGTTQPNISARIAALESGIDALLMRRDAGSVTLTEKGRTLLPAARRVLWSAEAFLEEAHRTDLIADKLRLGVTEIVAGAWLNAYLRRLREVYPSLTVELTVNLSREIERDLASGDLDLSLQTAPFAIDMPSAIELGEYEYNWVAAPFVADEFSSPLSLADAMESAVLMHAKHTTASVELLEAARLRGLRTDRVVHSNSLASCIQMAVDGLGLALAPRALTARLVSRGELHVMPSDWRPSPLRIFARYDDRRAPRFVAAAARLAAEVERASGAHLG
ncbi:LysR family transcriptional regulator [Pikeienuella piscinae]|uniref:LysR family transcriptional regulator n=1 Tax=Pikeienuella piscinae TaxID=2748098 RepID=A0A7M3T601_9RHOB|nr:LysR family transcriptional regulator [Pikeienuella piscinae]QIE57432.1 LysR family transcriptional regulator [Pikeienuella piscinae]